MIFLSAIIWHWDCACHHVAIYLLLRSPWSLGILAVREDEEAAQATGVHVLQHKLLALALSSFFAGLAGRCVCLPTDQLLSLGTLQSQCGRLMHY